MTERNEPYTPSVDEEREKTLRDYAQNRYLAFLEHPEVPWLDQPEGTARQYAKVAADMIAEADRIREQEKEQGSVSKTAEEAMIEKTHEHVWDKCSCGNDSCVTEFCVWCEATRPRVSVDPSWIEEQRNLSWPNMHPEDYCHKCGQRNPKWCAPAGEWRTATARWSAETGREGICCPACFAEMYEQATGTSPVWIMTPWQGSWDKHTKDACECCGNGCDCGCLLECPRHHARAEKGDES